MLVDYRQKYGNLSLNHMKKLSIPPKNERSFSKCLQYDVNFTEIYVQNDYRWPASADPLWPESECQQGWTYDKSEFENTLVTEVSFR